MVHNSVFGIHFGLQHYLYQCFLHIHSGALCLPVHSFFTSPLTGCTAIRYFGSASERVKQKVRESLERDIIEMECGGFTNFSFVWFAILRELNELLREQSAAIAEDVALQLSVHMWLQELQRDGVSYSTDPNPCGLSAHW